MLLCLLCGQEKSENLSPLSPFYLLAQTIPLSGAIRLYRNGTYSQSFTSGRVQVFGVGSFNSTSNRWGNICRFSSFGQTEADVTCHQLTFSGASSYSYAQRDS